MPDAKNQHHQPGQGEPRSYGRTHHADREIDLNTANEQELAELPMVARSGPAT